MRLYNLELMLEKALLSKPKKPISRKMLFKNATPQAMRDAVSNGSYSFAIVSDEATNVFDSPTTHDSSFFNDGYSTSPIRVDRKTSPSFVVDVYAMTVLLMAQDKVMRGFLTRKKGRARGDGFLSRFLITYPESMRGYKFMNASIKSNTNIKTFQNRITELLNIFSDTLKESDAELNQKTIRFSPEASDLFIEFFNLLQLQMQPGQFFGEDRDLASRVAENASRLACIFHVFENGLNGEISADTFDRAATICLWFLHQSKRILDQFSSSQDETDMQLLYNWLEGELKMFRERPGYVKDRSNYHGNMIQLSYIYLNCRPNRLRRKAVLIPAIQGLVDRGVVQHITKPKPAYLYLNENWFNNPNVNVSSWPAVAIILP